jgi:pimeloyl-ACP methyl ester carboxylesterase
MAHRSEQRRIPTVIAYDRIGDGPPIVFLHSGLANRTMWEPQVAAFSARYTCYLVDSPGYGDSEDPPSPFSYENAIARFIEEQVGQRAAMIGSSYGAGICFETALIAPDWTGPLVLTDGIIELEGKPSAVLRAIWTDADAAWERGERERAVEIETEGWVDGQGRPEGTAAPNAREYFTRANRAVWERQEAHPRPELLPGPEHEFERIQQPVLLIDGPFDVPDAHMSNRILLERLPRAEYVSIPGAAHFPSYEQPADFNRIVLEFLDRTWGVESA